MNRSKKMNNCRLCDSNKLIKIIDFGKVPLGNNLTHSKKSSNNADIFDLCLIRCSYCKHFQLNYEVSPDKLYATNYTYLSGVAPSFIKHFDITWGYFDAYFIIPSMLHRLRAWGSDDMLSDLLLYFGIQYPD